MANPTHPLAKCAACTHPQLNRCHDNTKLAGHGPAHYKMEWIYMRTKVSSPDSLELALEMKKKERKRNGHFLNIWFWHACTIDLMNDLGLDR